MLFIFRKLNVKRNGKKWNETQNETVWNPKPSDIQGYVDSLKSNFDPSRAKDREFIGYQLEQIYHHLGGLVEWSALIVVMNEYTPILILLAVSGLTLLYFLAVCRHKYRVTLSNQHRDVLQCRKCSKRVIVLRSKYRKV